MQDQQMKTWQEALEAATAKKGVDSSEITLDGSCRTSAVEVGDGRTLITCFAAGESCFNADRGRPPAQSSRGGILCCKKTLHWAHWAVR